VRDEDKKVEVYLSNGGKVIGRIEGAAVNRE
jgi:sRNA-binding regulator protein Hfq